MRSKDPRRLLQDIVENIDRIGRFTDGVAFDSFVDNEGEDLRGAGGADRAGGSCRQTGNVLRRGYDAIDLNRVWKTVTDDLPVLRLAVMAALQGLEAPREPAAG